MVRLIKRNQCQKMVFLVCVLVIVLLFYVAATEKYDISFRHLNTTLTQFVWKRAISSFNQTQVLPADQTLKTNNDSESIGQRLSDYSNSAIRMHGIVARDGAGTETTNALKNAHQDKQHKKPKQSASFSLGRKSVVSLNDDPYRIINTTLCTSIKRLDFIVIVHTATEHFSNRRAIRETWAGQRKYHNKTLQIAFLLGETLNITAQAIIDKEQAMFGDIVQGKFIDTYHNLTHKAVLGIRWIAEHCAHALFILKVDDDVFVNVFKLMDDFLQQYAKRPRTVFGLVRANGTAVILRRPGSKWMVDKNEFPNLRTYPFTYCLGFFVIYTSDIIPEFLAAARVTPFFWIDDIYVSGMLVNKIGNVTFTRLNKLANKEPPSMNCYNRTNPCGLLGATAQSAGVMEFFWEKTLNTTAGIK